MPLIVSGFLYAGEYLELSEDKSTERHLELLAEFERRKKVNNIEKSVHCNCSVL